MTEVKHFNDVLILPNSVINYNWAMLQFSDARPLSDSSAHWREPAKQLHMVEECATKFAGGLAIVLGYVTDDFSKVA